METKPLIQATINAHQSNKNITALKIFLFFLFIIVLPSCNKLHETENKTPPSLIDEVAFEDPRLLSCVVNAGVKTINELTELHCDGWSETDKIKSTKGIEQLTALQKLSLPYQNISQIDLSRLTALEHLDLSNGPDLAALLDYRPDESSHNQAKVDDFSSVINQVRSEQTGDDLGVDLSINGDDFFVVDNQGEQLFVKELKLHVDTEGNITTHDNYHVQGKSFESDDQADPSIKALRIENTTLPPAQTTQITTEINLDARSPVLHKLGSEITTTGNSVMRAWVGLKEATPTVIKSKSFTLPLETDFSRENITFKIEVTNSSSNNGTVSLKLDSSFGIPSQVSNFNELRYLADIINTQLFSPTFPEAGIGVYAEAVDLGFGNYRLEFRTLKEGEASRIMIRTGNAHARDIGLKSMPAYITSQAGIPAATNAYPEQSVDITDSDGLTITYQSTPNASAASIASELNAISGVKAEAKTRIKLLQDHYTNANSNLMISINSVNMAFVSPNQLAKEINELSSSVLPGFSAMVDNITEDIHVISETGEDISICIDSPDDGDSVGVIGKDDSTAVILEVDKNNYLDNDAAVIAKGNHVVVGGEVKITLDDNYTLSNAQPPSVGLFSALTNSAFQRTTFTKFNVDQQSSYNSVTTTRIYDALGGEHLLEQYFVKQHVNTQEEPNLYHWKMYTYIDGEAVGPASGMAQNPHGFDVYFNQDGTINTKSENVVIRNWNPVIAANNLQMPEDRLESSPIVIKLGNSTQYAESFQTYESQQNGFQSGRFTGLRVDNQGSVYKQFSNHEEVLFGQLAVATIENSDSLQAVASQVWQQADRSNPVQIRVMENTVVSSSENDIFSKLSETSSGSLSEIDLSHNVELSYIDLSGNNLSTINLDKNNKLNYLDLNNNLLTYIDLTSNTALQSLNLWKNEISMIDLSQNVNLENLDLWGNNLQALDLSSNPNLKTILLNENELSCNELNRLNNLFENVVLDKPSCF